ncbi:MAG: hypothetical protein ABSC11_12070 [Smithella sp.]
MKRHVLIAIILGLAMMIVSAAPVMADWAGVSQCFINGQWVTVKGNCPASGGGGSSSTPAYDYEAERQRQEAERQQQEAERQRQLEAERQRQQELEEQRKLEEEAARKRQEEFEQNKQEALKSMKGITEGELGLKGSDTGDLGLKDIGDTGTSGPGLKERRDIAVPVDASVVDLRDKKGPLVVDLKVVSVQKGVANPIQLRNALLGNFSDAIQKRTDRSNKQVQEIMRSFKTGEPPSPVKNIKNLDPGDVVLVAKDTDIRHLKDYAVSKTVNFLDRWSSDNWSSPASHAAVFLGMRDGKRWYLDNTMAGPIIKEEKEFLKEYGQRKMDVATLVGQPLSHHEGEELWKGANELKNTIKYGIWANDRMVCSDASRWLLMRSGRRVPETQSKNAEILGVDTGLNKKQFVKFSPSDFYEDQQYFIVHQLGVASK